VTAPAGDTGPARVSHRSTIAPGARSFLRRRPQILTPVSKILFLGQIGIGQTSLMRMRALERLGYQVRGVHTTAPWHEASWYQRQLQRRTERGSIIDTINRSVLAAATSFRPDVVWAEKQEFLRAETIQRLAGIGARTVHFTPDPYFSLPWKRTRLMDAALEAFDALVYCKAYERSAYEALGKPLIYMPLGYCDEVHRPLVSAGDRWACDVGFLGGWEPRRQRLLHSVVSSGSDLKIWGGYWDFLRDGRWSVRKHLILRQLAGRDTFTFQRDELLARAHQGGEVYGDDYARALTGARIGLGFLRKVSPDQHTTRTFEIPACGSMLLADRTEEHQSFFEEGVEAEFFDSEEELVSKVTYYRGNDGARRRVARRGLKRCVDSGYAYVHRLQRVLGELA
jgi:spore maturation protein CgeB